MNTYIVRDKEAGNVIDSYATYTEAAEAIVQYEERDRKDGVYVRDFYEIVCD